MPESEPTVEPVRHFTLTKTDTIDGYDDTTATLGFICQLAVTPPDYLPIPELPPESPIQLPLPPVPGVPPEAPPPLGAPELQTCVPIAEIGGFEGQAGEACLWLNPAPLGTLFWTYNW